MSKLLPKPGSVWESKLRSDRRVTIVDADEDWVTTYAEWSTSADGTRARQTHLFLNSYTPVDPQEAYTTPLNDDALTEIKQQMAALKDTVEGLRRSVLNDLKFDEGKTLKALHERATGLEAALRTVRAALVLWQKLIPSIGEEIDAIDDALIQHGRGPR